MRDKSTKLDLPEQLKIVSPKKTTQGKLHIIFNSEKAFVNRLEMLAQANLIKAKQEVLQLGKGNP